MKSHDALIDSCDKWSNYPCNLLRPMQLASNLDGYRRSLDSREGRLFNSAREDICFHELQDGDKDYQQRGIRNSKDVISHLDLKQEDPKCRFVFIQSANSRSPLNCSRKSFAYISSFHQVPPTFLDFVSSFGRTTEPLDYHMTGFNSSINVEKRPTNDMSIPELGRSGCEHNVQYLLRAVEPNTKPGKPTTWNIRPMAVHHTYDFITGKALWINVKANDLMQERIIAATKQPSFFEPSTVDDQTKTFAATLKTHLTHIEWCDENWRQCINDIEAKIRDVIVKAQTARIDQHLNVAGSALVRAVTLRRAANLANLPAEKSIWGIAPIMSKIGLGSKPHQQLPATTQLHPSSDPSFSTTQRSLNLTDQTLSKQLEALNAFSFGEIQDLHYQGELLESYCLVMELNQQTLRDIAEHYHDLLSRCNFSKQVKRACNREVRSFTLRVERIRKNLQIRITQIKSLTAWLEAGKSLFDGILQYQSVQIGFSFTLSSYLQSEKMEKIAYKTERETISMHVITCVTLAFLPGTFIAAFFQSGLIEINEKASGLRDAVTLHPKAFHLFLTICIPLMFLTFCLWISLFRWLSRKAQLRKNEAIAEFGRVA